MMRPSENSFADILVRRAVCGGIFLFIELLVFYSTYLTAIPVILALLIGAGLTLSFIGIGRWIGGCGLVTLMLGLAFGAYAQNHVDFSAFAPLLKETGSKHFHLPLRALVFAGIWACIVASLGSLLGDYCLPRIQYRRISSIVLISTILVTVSYVALQRLLF